MVGRKHSREWVERATGMGSTVGRPIARQCIDHRAMRRRDEFSKTPNRITATDRLRWSDYHNERLQ
ncbi:hypothetical protein AArc1_2868 [Natrarchaeobaculum sulfurireducens]|uniref:Uncharacterized protein n=1 Tax=Natrarchaeobaculum sulfurireducens TaxID=2044521 RepID=A0A346PI32_9EURY|nr:hypothetical protein AArc1_2868 [Natrarchaeobaculum sulfurireducens]